MNTAILNYSAFAKADQVVGSRHAEIDPPADRFASLPDPATLPADQLGREIAIFLHEHPDLLHEFGTIDLFKLDADGKAEVLSRIRTALDIPDFRRTRLGYVGPRRTTFAS